MHAVAKQGGISTTTEFVLADGGTDFEGVSLTALATEKSEDGNLKFYDPADLRPAPTDPHADGIGSA